MLNSKIYICFLFIFFVPFSAKSLNAFEMSLIGIGSKLVYDQYFDRSLKKESNISKKSQIIEEYYNSRQLRINSQEFKNLPLQEKLMIIEIIQANNY